MATQAWRFAIIRELRSTRILPDYQRLGACLAGWHSTDESGITFGLSSNLGAVSIKQHVIHDGRSLPGATS
ncbi:hypothetical protein RvY_06478 [Ramazzottius varieornatus]|uniref:Uncharacterized protein n=1 Tax=Ramazzottius varieornatus TaxID=947166 RepID=A0A1D1UYR1_RAMVA|nr:hypothetical protein RvY_06478 [Ramazzottius varieornatus]